MFYGTITLSSLTNMYIEHTMNINNERIIYAFILQSYVAPFPKKHAYSREIVAVVYVSFQVA